MDETTPRRELTSGEKWAALGFIAFLLALFGLEIARDYHPVKLTILFVLLWHMPLLLWHEVAHALMARAVGWGVRRVVVGFGWPVHRFTVRELEVEIRIAPVLGFTTTYPRDDRWPRTKDLLISCAGPASALLVLGVVILAVGWERLITQTDSWGMLFVQSLAVAAVVDVITNLVPLMAILPRDGTVGRDVFVPNDGMNMLLAPFRSRLWYRQHAALWRQVEAGIMREPRDDF